MKINIIPLIIAALFLVASCDEKIDTPESSDVPQKESPENQDTSDPEGPNGKEGYDWEYVTVPHYILQYMQPERYDAHMHNNKLVITLVPNSASVGYAHEMYPAEFKEEAAAYRLLCEKYGDLSYDLTRSFYGIYRGGYDYSSRNISSIEIRSATDYDEAHPAGTVLNDICVLATASPYRFIKGGYEGSYDWKTNPEDFDEFFTQIFHTESEGSLPFRKPLSECTTEDLILIGNGCEVVCLIYFTHHPDPGNELQRFMILITDEEGQTYTAATEEYKWK